jgi:hypothetical protein
MSITRYFDPKAAEELRVRQGIIRKSSIVRSLNYKRQFREWRERYAEKGGTFPLRLAYEQSFFQQSNCKWEQTASSGKLVFVPLHAANTSETLFLLDALKDNALKCDLQLFRAETWKCLDPEQGIEVHQRYLLRKRMPWLVQKLFARWIESDLVVVEAIYIEQIRTRLEIRHYPAPKQSRFANLHQLMAAIL